MHNNRTIDFRLLSARSRLSARVNSFSSVPNTAEPGEIMIRFRIKSYPNYILRYTIRCCRYFFGSRPPDGWKPPGAEADRGSLYRWYILDISVYITGNRICFIEPVLSVGRNVFSSRVCLSCPVCRIAVFRCFARCPGLAFVSCRSGIAHTKITLFPKERSAVALRRKRRRIRIKSDGKVSRIQLFYIHLENDRIMPAVRRSGRNSNRTARGRATT